VKRVQKEDPTVILRGMKYTVVIAEFSTGIVLNADGTWCLTPGGGRQEFGSEDEALAFARQHYDRNPDHECVVSDEAGHQLHLFRPPLTSESPVKNPKPRPWWKILPGK
jgi:hypothetical protein